jgi:hypothetical protein
MPWSRVQPHPLLVEWARDRGLTGAGRRAVVVGCGLGADAEYLARLGFNTVGFDISETAIELTEHRFPGSPVRYVAADLLDPPHSGCEPTTSWLRSSPSKFSPTQPAAAPSPTSAAWSEPAEHCLSLPPSTMTARRPALLRRGRCGGPRSRRSRPTDSTRSGSRSSPHQDGRPSAAGAPSSTASNTRPAATPRGGLTPSEADRGWGLTPPPDPRYGHLARRRAALLTPGRPHEAPALAGAMRRIPLPLPPPSRVSPGRAPRPPPRSPARLDLVQVAATPAEASSTKGGHRRRPNSGRAAGARCERDLGRRGCRGSHRPTSYRPERPRPPSLSWSPDADQVVANPARPCPPAQAVALTLPRRAGRRSGSFGGSARPCRHSHDPPWGAWCRRCLPLAAEVRPGRR